MADKQVKVALWCVPRSMSTVFAKCISAIDGMEVYLELYSYSASVSGSLHSATGRVLPKKLAGNDTIYEEALAVWKKETGSTLNPKRISCYDIKRDLESTKSKFVFVKEMIYITDYAQEYLPQGFRYVFLTREPTRVFTSFRKGLQTSGVFDLTGSNLDMIRDDPVKIRPMSWYEKQHQLWKYVQENLDPNPIIIDAFDLVSQPRKILKSFCEAVGFPYSDSLLQWTPSQDFPKNFVTVGENFLEQFAAFYSTALSSTHFMAPAERGPIPRDQLTDDVIRCVDYSMPFYREMYENRMQAS